MVEGTFDANAVLGSDYAKWGTQKLPLRWNSPERGIAFNEAYDRFSGLRERVFKKQVEQMTELLTQYGQIDFMWSDHWDAKDSDGLWRKITDLVEELQPNMVFMGPDTWVPGKETGHVVYPMWNAVDTEDGTKYSRPTASTGDSTQKYTYGLLEGDVRTGDPLVKFWRVRDCTTHLAFHSGGWFWHPPHVKKTYPRCGERFKTRFFAGAKLDSLLGLEALWNWGKSGVGVLW